MSKTIRSDLGILAYFIMAVLAAECVRICAPVELNVCPATGLAMLAMVIGLIRLGELLQFDRTRRGESEEPAT